MSKPDDVPTEIELKLRLLPGADAALVQSPCFAGVAVEHRHETTRYFDTDDLALQGNGLTLRVRSGNGRFVQTLKAAPASGGAAAVRGEWEWTVDGDEPVLEPLAGTPAAPLLPSLHGALHPVIVTTINRDVRRLALADGSEIEAAHDRGSIAAGDAREAVDELELELKRGTLASLYRTAIALHATVPMYLAPESKSARGYRLRSGAAPAALHAEKPALPPKVRAHEALRIIVDLQLGALLANVAAAEAGTPEGIHQFRVGLRRLRSALVLFAPMAEPRAARLFADELRRLGRAFSVRRDRDVLCLETLPAFAADGETAWADMLRARAEADRTAALAPVTAALRSPGFTGLVLGLAAWCEGGAAEPELLGPGRWSKRLAAVAPDLLDRLTRKAARKMKRIDHPEGLHDLRKALKKLRYATEFVAGLYDADAVRDYRRQCADLQERLGAINDARVTPALAADLARGGGIALAPAVAALAAWSGRRERAAVEGLHGALTAFLAADPFWR